MKERTRNIVFFLIHFLAVLILYIGIRVLDHHQSIDNLMLIKQVDSLNVVTHKLNDDNCVLQHINTQNQLILQEMFKKNPNLKAEYEAFDIGK
jgi:hypothetical protein